jgi:hypothetical protein
MGSGVRRNAAACSRRIETKPPIVIWIAEDKDDFPPVCLGLRQALADQKIADSSPLPSRQDRHRPESQSAESGRHSRKHDVSDDPAIIDRDQRYFGIAVGSQLIDQLSFRPRREGCFNNRADGRIISRLFGTNDHAGMLSNPETPIEQGSRALHHSLEICVHGNSTTLINVAPAS